MPYPGVAPAVHALLGQHVTSMPRALKPARQPKTVPAGLKGDGSALARAKPGEPGVAERFELFACGVELANGFGELTDAAEQRRRLEAEMTRKQRLYGERYPIDEDFLAALALMPPACGCALGFDRLVMLATGASRIDQVIWTPLPEPGKDDR